MAVNVANFRLDARVEVQGAAKSKLLKNAAADHGIELKNRSTLTYDIKIQCTLPDPQPPRSLSYITGLDSWTATIPALANGASASRQEALDVHGPAAPNQRLHVSDVSYRLATGGVVISSGGGWVRGLGAPLPLAIAVEVV